MKKFLSVVLALVMTMSLVTITAGAKDFTDKSKITYGEAVDVISAVGVIDGYTDGSFNPSATLTRGAAAKIICNLILGPTTGASLGADAAPFKDVPVSNVFAGYIAYCSQQGIINGYADGTFKPAGTVTGYQFMKMLLGALGYDGKVEGFTGSNWSVAVAKLAVSIGLDDGNDSFVGTAAMTREQACLYAYNTLKATMVKYDNNGTSITVGGTTITTGASKAESVENTATKSSQTIKKDTYMQFAEKYFKDLKLTDGTDAFERPANTWTYKTASVGTYAKTADATYTAEVKMGTVYSDLGLGKTVDSTNVYYYIDGAQQTSFAIEKGNTTNKVGGNGALTQVYYDSDAGTVTISVVNTYVGKITATYAATSSRDAYVAFESKTGTGSTFETNDSYAVDDYVLYTASSKSGDSGVKSMAKAEIVTGTLTAYTAGSNITVAGTSYKSNCVAASKATISSALSNAMKTDVTVYLDSYGYVAYVDADAATDNYAVVLGYANAGSAGTMGSRSVSLLFADATIKTVTATDTTVFAGTDTTETSAINTGNIVSYRINSDGNYKLEVLADSNRATGAVTSFVAKGSTIVNNDSAIAYNALSTTGKVYANGSTKFLIKNGTNYSAYTGIANVPTVKLNDSKALTTVYVKNTSTSSKYATLIYIDVTGADTTVTSTSKDVMFIKGGSAGMTYDADGSYYSYDAIINGEITTVKTDDAVTNYMLFSGLGKDSKDVYDTPATSTAMTVRAASGTESDGVFYTIGTDKATNGSVTLGNSVGVASYVLSYSSDVKVFNVSSDGKTITASSIGSIIADTNDLVWYKMTSGEVTTIVYQTQDNGSSTSVATGTTMIASDAGNNYATPMVYSNDGSALSASTLQDAVYAQMVKDGCTSISINAGKWTFTKSNGMVVTGVTVAPVQVYKVTGELDNSTAAKIDATTNTYTYATTLSTGATTGVKVSGVWYVTNGATLTITFSNAAIITATTADSIAIAATGSTVTTSPVTYAKDTAADTAKTATLTVFTGDVAVALTGSTT